MPSWKVGVIGLGYVGLSTAVCFASRGIRTTGLDIDKEKLSLVEQGKAPFREERLDTLLSQSIRRTILTVTDDYYEVVRGTDILFITVGTPSQRNGSVNLSAVRSATRSLGQVLSRVKGYKLVAIKSTVTPGTTEGVIKSIMERESGKKLGEYGLAANPEFLREGSAINDTFAPDRIVIGTKDTRSANTLISFYRDFYGKSLPKTILTTPANAELIKYASNAFLGMKISFINEIASLCSKIRGTDVKVVAEGMGADKRIGPQFLGAGLGFGGSCFPKDLRALLNFGRTIGAELSVSRSALKINEKQPLKAVELAKKLLGNLKGKRISILGLSFKPGTSDMRGAVSVPLIRKLISLGAAVVAYDPAAIANARSIFGNGISYASSPAECVKESDCCIVVTEWPEFSKLLPTHFKALMRTPAVVDGRRVLNSASYGRSGVRFAAVGLGISD